MKLLKHPPVKILGCYFYLKVAAEFESPSFDI